MSGVDELIDDLGKVFGSENVFRMDKADIRDGVVWSCKIGISPGTEVALPGGCDLPMREAVEKAFKEVTGLEEEFTFSGWGDKLNPGEQAVLDNKVPDYDAEINYAVQKAFETRDPLEVAKLIEERFNNG